ncbi:hypothetical protein H2O64_05495 [Kordia sp. YSTF-M3]|uniref:PKD domain-containing protein n=1 Tax=Kordia aestuariivivens TaxID=2759037 RepID=A0ABR7Q6C7_9FLAO|nr:PKD domain-containing protein [Kordia aestuariivivens]MBC8754115.1 hypothetical protein [Kordia aestuariivivens]
MKTKNQILSIIKKSLALVLIVTFGFTSIIGCETLDDNINDENNTTTKAQLTVIVPSAQIVDCNGVQVLKFASMQDLHSQHLQLYTQYTNGDNDEQVLINFESSLGFLPFNSLRKKDNLIDDLLLPDDPNFSPFIYTTDPIFESFLNYNGEIIIGNYVYIVDDGCVWYKAEYSCDAADALMKLRLLMLDPINPNTNQEIYDIKKNYSVEQINACDNPIFDFESISENGGRPVKDIDVQAKGAGCGHQAFIEQEVISYSLVDNLARYRLTANYISIANNPDNIFDTFTFLDNADRVTIVQSSPLGFPTSGFNYSSSTGTYEGHWVEIEIDIANLNTFQIELASVIAFGEGIGCADLDTLTLDLTCPISISKKPISADTYEFSVTGITDPTDYNLLNNGVTWNFGDGQTQSNTGLSVVHTYAVPCDPKEYLVTASRENFPCGPNSLSINSNSPATVGDPCKFDRGSARYSKRVDGKRVRIKAKHKKNLAGTTKIKFVLRYRKDNVTKEISSNGFIHQVTGNTCSSTSIASKIPVETKTSKKALRVKFKESGVKYKWDAIDPYFVSFNLSNGWSHQLNYSKPCQ